MGTHTRTDRHGSSVRLTEEDPFFAEHGYTRAPVLVQWMATLRCGLACPHCLSASQSAGFDDMPPATALRLIDEVAELGVEEFLVTGGEPLVREDLPAVISRLAEREVCWSLNTAAMPTVEQQRAMEAYPPAFVAVSLDGPEEVHDSFRGSRGAFAESLEAIRYFSGLPGCEVAAGTTVTTHNFRHLRQTFGIVAASGAASWGIHLLVPEGRAAERKDLFLRRRQLRKLLGFVARMRTYFPVSLADEIGYCGDLEPLVRDVPWTCGAGRAQAVVLPDGEVVPCTTLDRSASAGSLHDRPLGEIWRDGFEALRTWRPTGRCGSCQYAPACGGGCWLQRRAGVECFREVWHVPDAVKTAAGVALCLGLLAGGQAAMAQPARRGEPPQPVRRPPIGALQGTGLDMIAAETGGGIEAQIVCYYTHGMPSFGRRIRLPAGQQPAKAEFVPKLSRELAADPAGKFFVAFTQGELPGDIPGRCKAVMAALATKERSLGLSALLWRALAEVCLDDKAPERRTPADRKALRTTLAALETTTLKWRKRIFEGRLDPYLARGRIYARYRFEMSKARRPTPAWLSLIRDTATERWGGGYASRKKKGEALEGYIERHPYAEGMRLAIVPQPPFEGVGIFSAAGARALGPVEPFGVFDVLSVAEAGTGPKISLRWPAEKLAVELALPGGAELTYADLLALAYRQHARQLAAAADDRPKLGYWSALNTNPLLAPVVRKRAAAEASAGVSTRADAGKAFHVTWWRWWLTDFWMF